MAVHPFVPENIEAAFNRRFIIDTEIAVGGQGAVFKAFRISRPDGTPSDELVALKLNLYRHQDIRMQREIAAMESIAHPCLARVVEHGSCDLGGRQTRYVAYEFVEGQTLSQRLKSGRLMESEVAPIGRDVSAAIAAIWARRIVHGDIKPSNIMLRNTGGAVLIDLGAARHLEQDNTPDARKPFGTAGYFSPEQARGEKNLSSASDIFSLGIVLLQCMLGRHPTDYHQNVLDEGIRASGGKLAASQGLICVLDKMLSQKPSFRPVPSDLSGYFQKLQDRMQADYDMNARPTQRVHG